MLIFFKPCVKKFPMMIAEWCEKFFPRWRNSSAIPHLRQYFYRYRHFLVPNVNQGQVR